jgi:hypothetical protein
MGDFSIFERGQIVGARLAGASVIKTTMRVSEVMFAYKNHGKTTLAMGNSGRK